MNRCLNRWKVFGEKGQPFYGWIHFQPRWWWVRMFGYPQVWFFVDGQRTNPSRILRKDIHMIVTKAVHDVEIWASWPTALPLWKVRAIGCSGYKSLETEYFGESVEH